MSLAWSKKRLGWAIEMVIVIVALMISLGSSLVMAQEKTMQGKEQAPEAVLIKWRGLTLTRQDFDAYLNATVPPKDQGAFRGSVKRIASVLESLQVQRTLAAEAKRDGLDKNEQVVRELEYLKEKFLARKRLEVLEKSLVLPDFTMAAKEEYDLDHKKYAIPEGVHAQHILISTDKRSKEEARKLATEIQKRALAGEDFSKLADQFSEDPSVSKNHGDLGFFVRGQMVKPFEDVAFAMSQPGQVSELVETSFGFHVIHFLEKRPETLQPFEDVKSGIIDKIKARYLAEQEKQYIDDIRKDPGVELDHKAIDAIYIDTDAIIRETMEKMRGSKNEGASMPLPGVQ